MMVDWTMLAAVEVAWSLFLDLFEGLIGFADRFI